MRVVTAVVVACAIAGLLYLSLDSGRFAPPAERAFSMPLVGLGVIFAGAAWAASKGGYPERVPFSPASRSASAATRSCGSSSRCGRVLQRHRAAFAPVEEVDQEPE